MIRDDQQEKTRPLGKVVGQRQHPKKDAEINAVSIEPSAGFAHSEKSAKLPLTVKPSLASLKYIPKELCHRNNIKQTNGGKVKTTQPPHLSGFFISATMGDSIELSGVARNTTPLCGNTCSVSIRTLNGSRLPFGSQNIKQSNENHTMQALQTPAIGAPAHLAKGCHLHSGTACLIPFETYRDALHQAKLDKAKKGRGRAYVQLLNAFHQAILPLFFAETQGNLSEVSRLMGIHRETIGIWCKNQNIRTTPAREV